MRVLVLVTLLSTGMMTPWLNANAEEKISQLEYDLLKVRLSEQLKSEQYDKALESIASLKSSGYQYSPSLIYFQGFAYLNLERLVDADSAFRAYIEITGTEGKHYKKALQNIVKIEKKVEQAGEQNVENQQVVNENAKANANTWEVTPEGNGIYYDIEQLENGDIVVSGDLESDKCQDLRSWRTTRLSQNGRIIIDRVHCEPRHDDMASLAEETPGSNKANQKTWRTRERKTKSFGVKQPNAIFNDATSALDGGALIVGQVLNDDKKYRQVILLRVDQYMKQRWAKVMPAETDKNSAQKVIAVEDGFVIVGNYHIANANQQGWIFKVDDEGQVVWSQIHGGIGPDRFTGISQLSDGSGYLVIGQKNGKGWIAKLNQQGRLE